MGTKMAEDLAERAAFDVVILGAGMAGVTLARHLTVHAPGLRVALIDKLARPLPRFEMKVGESSLSPQGWYLGARLNLKDYMDKHQVQKWGVRFFYPGDHEDFASRPEVGATKKIPIYEWQFDRATLENDLRRILILDGVQLYEGYSVEDVSFGSGDGLHRVTCRSSTQESKPPVVLETRWFVDATGRSRFIHRRTGKENFRDGRCSAVWWRVKGWIDLEDFVTTDERGWRSRVDRTHPVDPRFGRINSTNHLINTGYWVWLIPLPDNVISVGIVAMESIRPFEEFNTHDKAIAWLEKHEPRVARAMAEREKIDFKVMRRYSYPADEILPSNRVACVGEALGFIDPLYSPGGDTIAVANSIIVDAIVRERAGTLTDDDRARANSFLKRFVDEYTYGIQAIYPLFGHSRVGAWRWIWDLLSLVANTLTHLSEMADKGALAVLADSEGQAARERLFNVFHEMSDFTWHLGRNLGDTHGAAHLPPYTMVDTSTAPNAIWKKGLESVEGGAKYADTPWPSHGIPWSVRVSAVELIAQAMRLYVERLLPGIATGGARDRSSNPQVDEVVKVIESYMHH
ncbi:MAG TPA: tryptophan 7-halogenase [Hyalangium sp.]|nr:tryptophan 7-halogenase [Hyalangium sp.]